MSRIVTLVKIVSSEDCGWEYNDVQKSFIPAEHWTEITDDELEVYQEYVHILNKKHRRDNISYMLFSSHALDVEDELSFEAAKEAVDKRKKDEAKADAKRKAAAKKAAETRKKNKKAKAIKTIAKGLVDAGLTKSDAEAKAEKLYAEQE